MVRRCPVCDRVYENDERFCSHDGTTLGEHAADPRIGRTIDGRYLIGKQLGRGGMGMVYEAQHVGLSRRVAIKFLIHDGVSETALARFRREARLASRVVHDHVVQVYDVGTDQGDDFIAMEYVEGRDLDSVIREGPLEVARAVAIARAMLAGLGAIHAQGIVHRDVKPSNVRLMRRGDDADFVKVMDFGISRAVDEVVLTATNHMIGTPLFMAPEQFRGADVDHRADLYAVGVTLFAMLAGDVPFTGSTAEVAMKHIQEPPPLERIRRRLPDSIAAAIARALAKDPADRFADAQAFADALADGARATAATTDVGATVVARPSRVPPVRPTHRGVAIAAVAVIVAAGAGGWWFARRTRVHRSPPPDASARVAVVVAPPIDAPAPADADPWAIDAAEVLVVPVDAGARHAAAPPITSTPRRSSRCRCLSPESPDRIALCPTKGPSLCRCDTTDGQSLCSTPLAECMVETLRVEADRLKVSPETICHLGPYSSIRGFGCPDHLWNRFHTPGTVDEPCAGYTVPREDVNATRKASGHLECDVCAGVETNSYRGTEGDACEGYFWRTGAKFNGTLQYCN